MFDYGAENFRVAAILRSIENLFSKRRQLIEAAQRRTVIAEQKAWN
jgi:hypothetical protein